jgi:uncharacterized membrane protein
MKTFNIFFLILTIILLMPIANAVSITTQSVSGALCPREIGLFSHLVKNADTSEREYTVRLSGSAAQWATVLPTGFILKPGEEKNLYTYVTPSNNAEAGNYNLNIEVGSPGDTNTVSHTVTVKQCYGATVMATPSSVTTCPKDPAKYSIILSNKGEYKENFKVNIKGQLAEKITLTDNTVLLGKGESKEIFAFVDSPAESGQYSFSITVDSDSGRIKESLTLFLNVNPCYDFKVNVQGDSAYSICENSYITIPVTISNQGTTLNNYLINIDGPNWAKMENNQIILKDKEVKTVNFIFNPAYGTQGEYGIRMTVSPERGNVKATNDFSVIIRKCDSVDTQFLVKEENACKGSTNYYQAIVRNDGETKRSYKIELDGPEWVGLSEADRLTSLLPGQQKQLNIMATPTSETTEKVYKVTLKSQATDESGKSAVDSDTLNLNVKDVAACYKPLIETKYEDVTVYYDSNVAVPIEITNEGLRPAEYSLILSGNAAKFASLNPSSLKLDTGKTEIVFLYVAPNVDITLGSYDASVAIHTKNGPLLETQDINVEITDVESKATLIVPEIGAEEVNTESFITKVKNAFFRINPWIKYGFLGLVIAVALVFTGIKFFKKGKKKVSGKKKKKKESDVEITREVEEIKDGV